MVSHNEDGSTPYYKKTEKKILPVQVIIPKSTIYLIKNETN